MPGLQVVDLSPLPRTEETSLEKTLSAFSKRHRENQVDQQETDALRDIYDKYKKDGQNIEDAIMAIQTRPGLSPTTRVNSVKQLMDFQKYNYELQQKAKADTEKAAKKTQNQAIISDLEQRRGLTPGSLNAYVDNPQMAEQITRPKKNLQNEDQSLRAIKALEKSNATPEQIALYEAAPVGGKTKIIENVLESSQRNKPPPGLTSPDMVDYDAGLTPKERVKRQDARFSLQTPLVNKNSEILSSLENEELSLNLLDELTDSGKVGEGISKLNINPKTGDLIIPQLASPEEQLFVKTVNDFTVKAKDSFGARVTNFELDRFMQRLPTLANSAEGRKLILRQMKIVNELNQMDKKAIQQVFDQYGVRNIDYVDAENKAREQIKDQKEALRKEYYNLEQLAKKEDAELVKKIKSKVQEGYTAMRKPDGTIKQFPTKNVPNLEEKGYKRL